MTQQLYRSIPSLLKVCIEKGDKVAEIDHFIELNKEELKSYEVRKEVEAEILRQNEEYHYYTGEYIQLCDFPSLWLKHALLVTPPENNLQ